MLLHPLNVRTTISAVHVSRDSRHNSGCRAGGIRTHISASCSSRSRLSAHGIIVRRRRALRLLSGSLSYGTRRRAAMAHTRRCCNSPPRPFANEKTKRPTRVACAGGASKLLDSKERPTARVSPFVYLRHYGLRVNLERSPTSSYSTDSRPRPTRASSSTAGQGPAVGCSGAKSRRRTWSYETKFSRVTIFEGRAF